MGFSPFPCLYAEEGVWKEKTEALGVRQEKAGEIGPSCWELSAAARTHALKWQELNSGRASQAHTFLCQGTIVCVCGSPELWMATVYCTLNPKMFSHCLSRAVPTLLSPPSC